MRTEKGANEQPGAELKRLRQRVAQLEQAEVERKRVEEALSESERNYRVLFESTVDGVIVIDETMKLLAANRAAAQIGGFDSIEELLKSDVLDFIPPEEIQRLLTIVTKDMFGNDLRQANEFRVTNKAGKEMWVSAVGTLTEYQGKPAGLVSFRDVTQRKKAEEALQASLKEKEVLLDEIHHRVKNNMQVISSLLKLQSRDIKDEHYAEMLKESQSRVNAMALIHEKLYQSPDLARIDFGEYIKGLAGALFRSHGSDAARIALKTEVEGIMLGANHAMPCGLIVNELVSNSLKHAFPKGREGEIKIAMRSIDQNEVELVVSDNGIGVPEDLDFRNMESLGLQLVTILAEDQLGGQIELDRTGGTRFQIRFGVAE